MKNLLAFSIVWLPFAFGCASHSEIVLEELNSSAEQYIGKNTDALVLEKGPPDFKDTLSTGDTVWSYRKQRTGEKKGIQGLRVRTGDEPANRETVTWYEITNFVIGPDGIIQKYTTSVE